MKPNKALQEIMAKKAGAAERYAELPDETQLFVNAWATLKPQERVRVMLEIASKPVKKRNVRA